MELPERYKNFGVNHIAMVVSNADETSARLLSAGYKKN